MNEKEEELWFDLNQAVIQGEMSNADAMQIWEEAEERWAQDI